MTEKNPITLFSFLERIETAILDQEPFPVWIHCEITDIKMRSAYAFLDLQECDSEGKKIAATSAAVWSQHFQNVFTKFKKMTNQPLQKGMKTLIQVEASFSPQWGFRLLVLDIDPTWTLGEAQRNNEEIRKKLKQEGFWDNNKQLPNPQDFCHVAVICPEKSAGEGDFFTEAQKLISYHVCLFTNFTASFEGQNVQSSLTESLLKIKKQLAQGIKFDAVCIIRGGGSSTGFTWLNQYEIIKTVSTFPIPVFSGIGHEKDSTLIDEVAQLTFGTPSKVVNYIMDIIISNAQNAFNHWQEINQLTVHNLESLEKQTKNFYQDTFYLVEQVLNNNSDKVEALIKEGLGLGPLNTLSRGYSITQKEDKTIITDTSQVVPRETISIKLHQGSIQAAVLAVEPHVEKKAFAKEIPVAGTTKELESVETHKTDSKKKRSRKDKQY